MSGTIEGNDVMLLGKRACERDNHVVERRYGAVQEDDIGTRARFGIGKPMVAHLKGGSLEAGGWRLRVHQYGTPILRAACPKSCRKAIGAVSSDLELFASATRPLTHRVGSVRSKGRSVMSIEKTFRP
ncbi:hypothetical protein GGR03_004650 [Aurantimonas endophytica]|uniref:Uncharacterized protein n=1 Tax=Aurantimonas endophytica TaxID=1522175 RepID=A0A7W6HIG9_9HYPH|nr:hypothetical protein [Aurantimonas endophytica]